MELGLQNHVVVVTGGASGIGRAVADAFAAEDAHVALWDLADNTAEVAAQIAEQANITAIGCQIDITDRATVDEAVNETISRLGSLDHLVHCAAIGSQKFGFPFTNLRPEDWLKVLDVNIMGMVNIAHAVTPKMVTQGHGTMVMISSIAGQIGSPTDPPYSASKAANINFAQCMAKDLASHGIRVNTVCPGMVKTPLNEAVWKAWHDQQASGAGRSYDDWAGEKIKNLIPLGQWQQPQDIADMVVFLSSDRTNQVTGQTINVDGGFVMHW
jgi:2-hydroxycyclohexanecarboxyl-CoA dehydrogenase